MTRTSRLLTAAALLLCASVVSADSTQALERAFSPYYAALVSSARGNIDATSRHLLLFASRWETASWEARKSPPREIEQDPEWPALLDEVNAVIKRARELVRQRDVAGAHAELEAIRLAIRDMHARHHALTFDDHMTDYHDALERTIGHVAGRNEIRLTPRDFADVDEDLQAAKVAWQTVQATAGPLSKNPAWMAAARSASASLEEAQRAIAAKNTTAVGRAAERAKATYYDLLLAVSRARD